jgi:hypothetical protein
MVVSDLIIWYSWLQVLLSGTAMVDKDVGRVEMLVMK